VAQEPGSGEASACPPVLVVLFNRPDVTEQLVDSLRAVRPSLLFVSLDGPRTSHPADVERCSMVRACMDRVDWPCEIRVLRHAHNVGLQSAMIEAIDWFLGQVDAGVILEDDCLAHPDFFAFAGEMLERHRTDGRVMAVSALNMDPEPRTSGESYFFASGGHIWGWATWRRAWAGFDPHLSEWPQVRDEFETSPNPLYRALACKFAAAYDGRKCTWARAWHFHVARHRGLVVIPVVNLVANVGLGPDATHTTSPRHSLAGLTMGSLAEPYVHPARVAPDAVYDRTLARFHTWTRRRRARERWRSVSRSIRRRAARATAPSPLRG
jgi:glycosyltransferase involved in cell wall biosynthesis